MREGRFRPGTATIVGVMALAATLPAAQANERKAPLKPLSRAELKECMARANTLDERQNALVRANEEHGAAHVGLSAEADALSRQLRALDESDALAVDKYNRRNDERNQKVEKANQRADALRRASDELKSVQADYLAECVARPFLQEDEKALVKEGHKPFPPLPKEHRNTRSTGSNDI